MQWWDQSVTVTTGLGKVHVVNNNHMAAKVLMEFWPKKKGRKHLAAREAVLFAYETGDVEACKAAREAFHAAAKEVGILAG